jgi:hypothetical protein
MEPISFFTDSIHTVRAFPTKPPFSIIFIALTEASRANIFFQNPPPPPALHIGRRRLLLPISSRRNRVPRKVPRALAAIARPLIPCLTQRPLPKQLAPNSCRPGRRRLAAGARLAWREIHPGSDWFPFPVRIRTLLGWVVLFSVR